MVKDKIVTWFIRNIILAKNEIINHPGFIVLKLSSEKETTNLREIFIPEFLLTELENHIVEKYKTKGEQILYSVGKKFGYRYASNSKFPTLKTSTEKDFLNFSYIVVRYIETIYAKKITHEINIDKKIFEVKAKDYIVCSKNGLGYILTNGAISGVWTYGTVDNTIEGVQTTCQGRGDDHCEIVCAPEKYFVDNKIKFLKERDLSGLELLQKEYNTINEIRPAKFATNSFEKLLDSGFLKQKGGVITAKEGRYMLLEASLMYLLERELKKLKGGLDVLWDVSVDFGKKLAEISGKDDPAAIIMDLFPALGFGDIYVEKLGPSKYRIIVNYFPWTKWADEVDFTMFRGMLSGVISGSLGKKVELKKVEKDLSMGYLSLVIS